MKIGELARLTGTQVETIRYYEREGLLASPSRSDGNMRIYANEHAERLSFILHCRSLDMTLVEIRALLRFKDAPSEECGGVNMLLDTHIGHVAARIRELRALKKQLEDLRERCLLVRDTGHCGILEELSHAATTPATREIGHVASAHRTVRAKKGATTRN